MFRLITAMLFLSIMSTITTSAYAEDFDTFQGNLKIKWDKWDVESRQSTNSDKDHFQIGFSPVKDVNFQLRHVDRDDAEWRGRVTINTYSNDYFYAKSRLEYRKFETADDYWRVRPILGLKLYDTPSTKAYVEYQASFNLGREGEDNDFDIDSGQVKLGLKQQVGAFSYIEPFIQYEHNEEFGKTNLFLGTSLVFQF